MLFGSDRKRRSEKDSSWRILEEVLGVGGWLKAGDGFVTSLVRTWQLHWLHEVVEDELREHAKAVVVLQQEDGRPGHFGRLRCLYSCTRVCLPVDQPMSSLWMVPSIYTYRGGLEGYRNDRETHKDVLHRDERARRAHDRNPRLGRRAVQQLAGEEIRRLFRVLPEVSMGKVVSLVVPDASNYTSRYLEGRSSALKPPRAGPGSWEETQGHGHT